MAKGYLYDNGDELITREDVNEVPDSSSAHAGDVLELDSDKKPKWSTPESGLPSTGSASVGDVLTLDSDKEPVWSAPSGGSGYTLPFPLYLALSVGVAPNVAYSIVSFNDLQTPLSIDDIAGESGEAEFFLCIENSIVNCSAYDVDGEIGIDFRCNKLYTDSVKVIGVDTSGTFTGETTVFPMEIIGTINFSNQ